MNSNSGIAFSQSTPATIQLPPCPKRCPHTDTLCRDSDMNGLLTFLLLRHSSLLKISDDHPDKTIIEQARDNALNEIKWRIWQYEGALKMNGIGLILAGP